MTQKQWLPALFAIFAGFGLRSGDAQALEVGDPAPTFSLQGSDGQVHSLEDHRGKSGVVLAFFPKAFTPG